MFKDGYLYEQKHIQNVNIFILIALMVLVAAILNFINLNTARSAKQAKETGLRKAIGASRFSMARLIYSDVTGLCIIAFTAAIIFAFAGLPLFNHITGKTITFGDLFTISNAVIFTALFLLTVLLAGSYPALYLSSFTPGQTLSRNYQSAGSRGLFRNTLIVTMFAVSIILLSSTIIISKQTSYLQNMDLGYEKDQLMYVNLNGKLKEQVSALKEEIGRSTGVLSSCAVSFIPVMIGNNGEDWSWEGKSPDFKPLVTSWNTDEDMIKTMGAKMAEGEFIRKNQEGIVINRTFAKMIGWNDFTGKTIKGYGRDLKILGVVNDIRFNSLSEETKPMAIEMTSNWNTNYLLIKTDIRNITSTIDYIGKCCQKLEPAYPFEYSFLNDDFGRMLASEMNLKKLVGIFSGFAITVLCLGLLGLVMFFAEQRTKEIGIRKCLGENVFELIIRFIKPFVLSGIIAGAVAIPVTWLAMEKWLGNYASHISLSFWQFMLAGLIVIIIAVLTVIWQSMKAATRNPVEALRYE